MQQRLSLVTLGVGDVAAASNPRIAFFDLGGLALALFARDDLAADVGVAAVGRGFRAVTLAHNVAAPAAVDATLAAAVAAGARLVKPAAATSWGGYSGYFADPDGHLWEVAHNPFAALDDAGRFHVDGGR